MDGIPSPVLSSSELDEAIVKITNALDLLKIRYGLVGGAAISLYARHYGFPHRATSNISLVVLPSEKVSALEISAKFSEKRFEQDFVSWLVNGVRVPKVIVKRMEGDREKRMAVSFKLLDHYLFPRRRRYYDFDLDRGGNQRVIWGLSGKRVRLLNAPWLLRQKILAWGERKDVQTRWKDVVDIKALCDIVGVQKMRVKFWDEEEVEALRRFATNVHEDPTVFRTAIDCPQALGPWWKVRWIEMLLMMFASFVLSLLLDYIHSTNDWKVERDRWSFEELWQDL